MRPTCVLDTWFCGFATPLPDMPCFDSQPCQAPSTPTQHHHAMPLYSAPTCLPVCMPPGYPTTFHCPMPPTQAEDLPAMHAATCHHDIVSCLPWDRQACLPAPHLPAQPTCHPYRHYLLQCLLLWTAAIYHHPWLGPAFCRTPPLTHPCLPQGQLTDIPVCGMAWPCHTTHCLFGHCAPGMG